MFAAWMDTSQSGEITENPLSGDTGGLLPFQLKLHSLPPFVFLKHFLLLEPSWPPPCSMKCLFCPPPLRHVHTSVKKRLISVRGVEKKKKKLGAEERPSSPAVSEHGSTSSNSSPALFCLSLKMLSSWRLRMLWRFVRCQKSPQGRGGGGRGKSP